MDPDEPLWVGTKIMKPLRPEHKAVIALTKVGRPFKKEDRFLVKERRRRVICEEIDKTRRDRIENIIRWAAESDSNNQTRIDKSPPHVQHVLKSGPTGKYKQLELWGRLLEEVKSPQVPLMDELRKGFRSEGQTVRSKLDHWLPAAPPDDLAQRQKLLEEIRDSQKGETVDQKIRTQPPPFNSDEELLDVVQRIKKQEKKGLVWAVPRDIALGGDPSYSFGITQPDKVRLIIHQAKNNLASWKSEDMSLDGLPYISRINAALVGGPGQEFDMHFGNQAHTPLDIKTKILSQINTPKSEATPSFPQQIGSLKKLLGPPREERDSKALQILDELIKDMSFTAEELLDATPGPGEWADDREAAVHVSVSDFSGYYYQFPVESPDSNIIGIWIPELPPEEISKHNGGKTNVNPPTTSHFYYDPETQKRPGRYCFYKSMVLNMGNVHSVYSACRVSESIAEVLLKYLFILGIIYIDDTVIMQLFARLAECKKIYERFLDAIVVDRKHEKDRDTISTWRIRVLGADFCLAKEGSELVMDNNEERIRVLAACIFEVRNFHAIERIQAKVTIKRKKDPLYRLLERFTGVASYAIHVVQNSIARVWLSFLYWVVATPENFRDKFHSNRNKIIVRMMLVLDAIIHGPIVRFGKNIDHATTAIIAYDAATGGDEDPALGGVLIRHNVETQVFRVGLGQNHPAHRWNIGGLEALARLVATRTFLPLINKGKVLRIGDNAGVVLTGYAGSPDSKCAITKSLEFAVQVASAQPACSVEDGFMRSKLNPADAPTRRNSLAILRELASKDSDTKFVDAKPPPEESLIGLDKMNTNDLAKTFTTLAKLRRGMWDSQRGRLGVDMLNLHCGGPASKEKARAAGSAFGKRVNHRNPGSSGQNETTLPPRTVEIIREARAIAWQEINGESMGDRPVNTNNKKRRRTD